MFRFIKLSQLICNSITLVFSFSCPSCVLCPCVLCCQVLVVISAIFPCTQSPWFCVYVSCLCSYVKFMPCFISMSMSACFLFYFGRVWCSLFIVVSVTLPCIVIMFHSSQLCSHVSPLPLIASCVYLVLSLAVFSVASSVFPASMFSQPVCTIIAMVF